MQVDSVSFQPSGCKTGCWVIDITYTTGGSTGNFNTFYIPQAVGSDALSYDLAYAQDPVLNTFQPKFFPCGSNIADPSNPTTVAPAYTTCCLPKFVEVYRPLQGFINWTETFTNCDGEGKGKVIERPGSDYDTWDVDFPGDYLTGQFKDMPDSDGVQFMGVVDAFINQYKARVKLDEKELRTLAGQLKGTVGVEHTVDTFIGIANFRPTGIQSFDPAAHQVNIHLEKTSFFSVSTHGVNSYTFLEYVNLRLVAVYREDANFVEQAPSFSTRTSRTNSSGAAHYLQVTFTMGSQYRPNLPVGLVPMDSIRAGKGTFFDDVATQDTVTHKCVEYLAQTLDFPFRRSADAEPTEKPARSEPAGLAQPRAEEVPVAAGAGRRLLHHGPVFANGTNSSVGTVGALDTCHEQSHCFRYTFEKLTEECENGDGCKWKVCQIHDPSYDEYCRHTDSQQVPKTFTQWCKWGLSDNITDTCPSATWGSSGPGGRVNWFEGSSDDVGGGAGAYMGQNCQIGRPGEWVFFIVQDSDTCGHFETKAYPLSKAQRTLMSDKTGATLPEGSEAYCQPRNRQIKGCENCGFYKNVSRPVAAGRRALRPTAEPSRSSGTELRVGQGGASQGGSGTSGTIETCAKQDECVRWEVTKVDSNSCGTGGCDYEVCLDIDVETQGCRKSDTISHMCGSSETECASTMLKKTDWYVGDFKKVRRCHLVSAGNTTQFLVKDAAQCGQAGNAADMLQYDAGRFLSDTTASVRCFPRPATPTENVWTNAQLEWDPSSVESCTGNAPGKECIWEVTAPSGCEDDPGAGGGGDGFVLVEEYHGIDSCTLDIDTPPEAECVWSIKLPDECPPDPSCFDGLQNQDEVMADCGGLCDACTCQKFAGEGEQWCGVFDPNKGPVLEQQQDCHLCECSTDRTDGGAAYAGDWGDQGDGCSLRVCPGDGAFKCGEPGSDCTEQCECGKHHPEVHAVEVKVCADNGFEVLCAANSNEVKLLRPGSGDCTHEGGIDKYLIKCPIMPTFQVSSGRRPDAILAFVNPVTGRFITAKGDAVYSWALNGNEFWFWPDFDEGETAGEVLARVNSVFPANSEISVRESNPYCGAWGTDGSSCQPCSCPVHENKCGTYNSGDGCEECTCQKYGPGNRTCGIWPNSTLAGSALDDSYCRPCECSRDLSSGVQCGSWGSCAECVNPECPCGGDWGNDGETCQTCTCDDIATSGNPQCGSYTENTCHDCSCIRDASDSRTCGTWGDSGGDCETCDCAKYPPAANPTWTCGSPGQCRKCTCEDTGHEDLCTCLADGLDDKKCGSWDECRACECDETPKPSGCPAPASRPPCPADAPPVESGEAQECCLPFDCLLEQDCAPGASMCVSPTDTPDNFVSINIPLGIDWLPAPSPTLDANVFVEMVINAVDKDTMGANGNPNGGDDPEQMKTTLFGSIPVVAGGVNIFCDGITAKTDLKDVANADIVVGSANSHEELTRLRILENIASTSLQAAGSTQIDSDSIEAGLMTLVLKGNESYFDNGGTSRHSLVLEDLITIHIMEPDTCGASCVFDFVKGLMAELPDDNFNVDNGLRALGYALNGAFDFEVERSALRAHLHPTDALLARCPFNPPRPSAANAFPTTCVTRRDVRDAGFPFRVGAKSTAMELEPLDANGACATRAELDDEVDFLQHILGASIYTENLAQKYSCVIAEKYKINGRYMRAYWINPGYEWTPTQTGGQSLFTISQKLILFALIRLDEGFSSQSNSGPPTPTLAPTLRRRHLLQSTQDPTQGTGAGSAGAVQEFDISVKGMMAKAYGVELSKVATLKLTLALTQAEACAASHSAQVTAARARLADLVEPHASKLNTLQILSLAVSRNVYDCSGSRRQLASRRHLLAVDGASADLEVMLVFDKDEVSRLDMEGLSREEGIQSVAALDVPAAVDTSKNNAALASRGSKDGEDEDGDSSSNVGIIAGAAAGGGVLLVIIGAVVYWRSKKEGSESVDIAGVYQQDPKNPAGSFRSVAESLKAELQPDV